MMKKHATFMALGLTALLTGCGEAPREEALPATAPELQTAPTQELPSAEQLAATRTQAPVTAVPVKYVVDPAGAPQLRISAGTESAQRAPSTERASAGSPRRSLK
ncbi:hypothetical protein JYJ95_02620 [Corallococcus exiguus]|uniref:hypothetical protein n=1 Tax=Corallococcus exiguus TaxID=83462 RepID=UPI001A8F591B|nr:hypothetical protein [Corallococcus exiguus]MBN8465388.1 hypothetical protein [Corallococcus exiguus]